MPNFELLFCILFKRLLLKHIERKANENIKNIIALERVMYQNVG